MTFRQSAGTSLMLYVIKMFPTSKVSLKCVSRYIWVSVRWLTVSTTSWSVDTTPHPPVTWNLSISIYPCWTKNEGKLLSGGGLLWIVKLTVQWSYHIFIAWYYLEVILSVVCFPLDGLTSGRWMAAIFFKSNLPRKNSNKFNFSAFDSSAIKILHFQIREINNNPFP